MIDRAAEPTWNFKVILDREPTDAELDAIYEAGLDDCAMAGGPDGRVWLMCSREAGSVLDAIASVLGELRTAEGPRAVGVDEYDDVQPMHQDIALADEAVKLACEARAAHQQARILLLLEAA
ncbi:hypothetical protein AB0I81_14365 [Nonomuraea sp. NPDC050404]|uniref:hypothetical protein n=1 Tax=Nonomuraea sp. NPDC050404 TaxID=3155783 RepID=UPI0033C8E380